MIYLVLIWLFEGEVKHKEHTLPIDDLTRYRDLTLAVEIMFNRLLYHQYIPPYFNINCKIEFGAYVAQLLNE